MNKTVKFEEPITRDDIQDVVWQFVKQERGEDIANNWDFSTLHDALDEIKEE